MVIKKIFPFCHSISRIDRKEESRMYFTDQIEAYEALMAIEQDSVDKAEMKEKLMEFSEAVYGNKGLLDEVRKIAARYGL